MSIQDVTPAGDPLYRLAPLDLDRNQFEYKTNAVAHRAFVHLKEAVAVAVLAVLTVSKLLQFRVMNFFLRKMSGKRPVVLVHGYCHNETGWIYVANKLQDAGIGPVYPVDLPTPFASIERDLAPVLAERIQRIREETGAQEIDIVTHSMGGLVATWYNEFERELHNNILVRKIVMLVPPLRGTPVLPQLRVGECGSEMQPGSDFLARLHERLADVQRTTSTQYTTLASHVDLLVPANSATLDEQRTKFIHDLGHLGVLFSPRVVSWVIEELRSAMQ